MFNKGDIVQITTNPKIVFDWETDAAKLVGKKATIVISDNIGKFKYSIKMLDPNLQKYNHYNWADNELVLFHTKSNLDIE